MPYIRQLSQISNWYTPDSVSLASLACKLVGKGVD